MKKKKNWKSETAKNTTAAEQQKIIPQKNDISHINIWIFNFTGAVIQSPFVGISKIKTWISFLYNTLFFPNIHQPEKFSPAPHLKK